VTSDSDVTNNLGELTPTLEPSAADPILGE